MSWALTAVRAVHFMATASVAGTLLFVSLIAHPALRAAAIDGERLRVHSARLVWSGLIVAVLSGAAWFFMAAAAIGDRPLLALDGVVWPLLNETQFGRVFLVRAALAALLVVLLLPPRGLRKSRVRCAAAAGVSAAMVAALAWSGHAGATPGWIGHVHAASDALHLLAAAAWLGGLPPLALALGQRTDLDLRRMTLAGDIVRRFSLLGMVSVAALLLTGIFNAFVLVPDAAALFASDYGRLLLVKVALFLSMVGLALVNRLKLSPLLAAPPSSAIGASSRAARALSRNAIAEILLGVGVFAIAAALGAMPPSGAPEAHLH